MKKRTSKQKFIKILITQKVIQLIQCIFLFLLIGIDATFGQNLILNHGFEEYLHCPKGPNNNVTKSVKNWFTGSIGADYYNKCGYICKKQEPRNGKGYAGFGLFENHGNGFTKEYIEGTLKCSLIKEQSYYFEMYFLLSKYYSQNIIALNKIDLYFFNQLQKNLNTNNFILKPDIEFLNKNFFCDTLNWMKLSGYYKASGGENYFIIGNFYPNDQINYSTIRKEKTCTEKKKRQNNICCLEVAYYFIDDVKLVPIDSLGNEIPCKCPEDTALTGNIDTTEIKVNEPVIIDNLYFAINKSDLLPVSYPSLEKLIGFLKENFTYKIEIFGHTDNTGKEEDNDVLSEARAKAVVDYLIEKGIQKERLSYRGFGSTQPIDSNDNEEGRSRNRRVEFKILSK
ncbi:MAG: OmpA family protein [Bacteroidetes bacterium]|nr:OmpA family protein [Bacteroidota bacterium]